MLIVAALLQILYIDIESCQSVQTFTILTKVLLAMHTPRSLESYPTVAPVQRDLCIQKVRISRSLETSIREHNGTLRKVHLPHFSAFIHEQWVPHNDVLRG